MMTKEFGMPQPMRGFRRCLLATAFAGLALVVACQGDNLFTGDSNEFSPQLQAISLPSSARAGESFSVRVDAAAARGISQILVTLSGAVTKDTVVTFVEQPTRISKVINVAIPSVLADTIIFVQASVVDKVGDVSAIREGMLVVFGPPAVTSMSGPATARLGELVSVRVIASGTRKITHFELVASGVMQKDTTIFVTPPRTSVTQDIIMLLPDVAQDTVLRLAVNARDEVGQSSSAVSRTVTLILDPPIVELVSPASARAGLNLDLLVVAQGARRITDVRIELRGAVTKDVTASVGGNLSEIAQNVSIPLPGDIRVSDLRARAAVIDRGQVLAFSEEDLITIPINPPMVTAVEVPLVAYRGKPLDIRVRASGDRPLEKIEIRARGSVDTDMAWSVTPANLHDVTHDFVLPIPATAVDSTLILRVTVTDVSGSVSEIFDAALSVADPPEPDLASSAQPPARAPGSNRVVALDRSAVPMAPRVEPPKLANDMRKSYLPGLARPLTRLMD
jgi:hypothetical protein